MFQYLVAKQIHSLVPHAEISGIDLTPWDIKTRRDAHPDGSTEEYPWHFIPLQEVAGRLHSGQTQRLILSGYYQRLENLPPRDVARAVFQARDVPARGFDKHHLVINIRAGEILTGEWLNYTVLPFSYYSQLIRETGLKPVFMGQLDSSKYCTRLVEAFPTAILLPSYGALGDFELMRQSTNLVLSVSTFSWLAGWLSDAQRIFMPLSGFFNPFQDRDVNLLPALDPRYTFHLFPTNYAVPPAQLEEAHAAIEGRWNLVTPNMLTCMSCQWPRFGYVPVEAYKPFFNEAAYFERYPDVAKAVGGGVFKSGWAHYQALGPAEKRIPFPADWSWYSREYPQAASEVGRGDFASLIDHYVALGHQRGYKPRLG